MASNQCAIGNCTNAYDSFGVSTNGADIGADHCAISTRGTYGKHVARNAITCYSCSMKHVLALIVMIGLSCSATDTTDELAVYDFDELDAGDDADAGMIAPLPTATATQSAP